MLPRSVFLRADYECRFQVQVLYQISTSKRNWLVQTYSSSKTLGLQLFADHSPLADNVIWGMLQNNAFSLVAQSCLTLCNHMYVLQHFRLPSASPVPGVCSNSCPSRWWCHPTISSSVIPFSSCLQSFPASGYFPLSQFFASGGQNIGVSESTSVLPMNTQDRYPLGRTDWISLLSKGLSRVFFNTTVQKNQVFGTQLSL